MSGASRGIYLERRVAEILAERGWFTIRAAGSHGIADVVAIRPGGVAMIQCKTDGNIRGAEWNRLWEVATSLGAMPVVAQYSSATHRGILFVEITGTHTPRSQRWPYEPWTPERVHAIPAPDKETEAVVQALELERLHRSPRLH